MTTQAWLMQGDVCLVTVIGIPGQETRLDLPLGAAPTHLLLRDYSPAGADYKALYTEAEATLEVVRNAVCTDDRDWGDDE